MKAQLSAPILAKLTVECPFAEVFEDTGKTEHGILAYPRSKIGHIRADHDGWRWWNTIWPCHDELATMEMRREIDATYDALTGMDALCDLPTLTRFCLTHPEAQVRSSGTEYNFYLEGDLCNYWLRLITRRNDYNLYLNAYIKKETR